MNNVGKNSDAGLWKRGMLLFLAMVAVAGVALFVALRRPSSQTTQTAVQPAAIAPLLTTPQAPFPANISWAALYQFADNLPSPPGWDIRYNATVALARHGSDKVPWNVLREMLDEKQQLINRQVRLANGMVVRDEVKARLTILDGLKAFAKWQEHDKTAKKIGQDNADLEKVYQAVERLTHSNDTLLRREAEKVQKQMRPTM